MPMQPRDCLRIEDVEFRYPGNPSPAVDGVRMEIPRGASVGVVGGSGAGNTALVDPLVGLLPPTSGRFTVDGVDIADRTRDWRSAVGQVPQAVQVSGGTIRRNIAFGVPDAAIRDGWASCALEAAQLGDFVRSLAAGLDSLVGERGTRLSGGQRQRIAVARARYRDPEVLVPDEATSSLDTDAEREVMAAVQALSGRKTLIIVTHRLHTVASCHVLFRVAGG